MFFKVNFQSIRWVYKKKYVTFFVVQLMRNIICSKKFFVRATVFKNTWQNKLNTTFNPDTKYVMFFKVNFQPNRWVYGKKYITFFILQFM